MGVVTESSGTFSAIDTCLAPTFHGASAVSSNSKSSAHAGQTHALQSCSFWDNPRMSGVNAKTSAEREGVLAGTDAASLFG